MFEIVTLLAILFTEYFSKQSGNNKLSAQEIIYPVSQTTKTITAGLDNDNTDAESLFGDDFTLAGTVEYYRKWVWLTSTQPNKVINFYLNDKIQLN